MGVSVRRGASLTHESVQTLFNHPRTELVAKVQQ